MKSPRRIIDANANRAREALRVLEEAARFLVEDAVLSKELKQMRHAFTQAMLPFDDLVIDRDTPGDVGTTLSTPAERVRQDASEVVLAAGSRLAEALRAVEEYAKINADQARHQADLVATCERLRYQSYDLTKRLTLALGSSRRQQWRLCLLLSESLCTHRDWRDVLEQAIGSGVDCVQVREKKMDSGPLLKRIREIIDLIDRRASVIVNDRPDLALLAGADGVHLGQTDLGVAEARKLLGHRMVIGVSTSNLDQAQRAKAGGADYCGVGPMFATTTKHKPVLAGPSYLREYLAWDGLAHLAIGGITPNNVGQLIDVGCRGIAVSSTICSAEQPGTVAAKLSEPLRATTATT